MKVYTAVNTVDIDSILLSHLSMIGTLIRKIFRKNNSCALCCVQEIGEPYNLDHNDA